MKSGSETRMLILASFTLLGTLAKASPITSAYDFSASGIGPTQNVTGLDLTAAVAAAAAVPANGSWELKPIGAPRGTGVLKMEITIVVNGNKVTKPVTIPKGDIVAYVRPDRMAGEKDKDYAARIADALGEASQAKSKVIADAINAAFKDEFQKLGETAGTGLTAVNKKIRPPDRVTDYDTTAFYGTVIIPGVSKELGNPVKFTDGKILGEAGNGGSYIRPAGPSPGARGSLERATPGIATVSTGVDPYGDPSFVDFGLVGIYVASFTPSPGMTDEDVLSTLAMMLNQNKVSATFDSSSDTLFLNGAIPDGTVLDWGSTDTGLEFTMSMEGLNPATVPEPSSGLLLLTGAALFCITSPFRLHCNGFRGNVSGLRLPLARGDQGPGETDCRGNRKPCPGDRLILSPLDQISADHRSETAEDRRRHAIGERESGSPYFPRHQLSQEYNHGAVITPVEKR
jgi:hypothetical protein